MVEFLVVKCRPFYLLREFTIVFVVAVYIPHPSANANANAKENQSKDYVFPNSNRILKPEERTY